MNVAQWLSIPVHIIDCGSYPGQTNWKMAYGSYIALISSVQCNLLHCTYRLHIIHSPTHTLVAKGTLHGPSALTSSFNCSHTLAQ